MGSNVPHKGIVKAGRLSPVIFGNFPVRSAQAGLNGDMLNVRLGNLASDLTSSPLEATHHSEAALSVDADNEQIVLTCGGTAAGRGLALASISKMDPTGRFALQCQLNVSNIADDQKGVLIGFCSARTGILDTGGAAAIPVSSLGLFMDRDDGDALKFVARGNVSGTAATITDLSQAVAAGTALEVGLVGKGDGKVRVYVAAAGEKLALKATVSLPEESIDPGYAVASINNGAATAHTLKLGSVFAAGVVD